MLRGKRQKKDENAKKDLLDRKLKQNEQESQTSLKFPKANITAISETATTNNKNQIKKSKRHSELTWQEKLLEGVSSKIGEQIKKDKLFLIANDKNYNEQMKVLGANPENPSRYLLILKEFLIYWLNQKYYPRRDPNLTADEIRDSMDPKNVLSQFLKLYDTQLQMV